jgi:predicted anti-sigma-YlaC factor YlaD
MATHGWQARARARRWVSLRIDDELSELESALLDAHLAVCRDCRSFADETDAVTRTIRG